MIDGIFPGAMGLLAVAAGKAPQALTGGLLDYIEGLIAFAVILGILVFVHELGHFTVAKLAKIRVDEFAFGFGPKWIRLFKKGETEYTIHPFPLGGFVKLAGMEPNEDQDIPGGFNTKPVWVRMAVILAGPGMNIVLALVVFILMGFTVGAPVPGVVVKEVLPHSEASRVGLQPGDTITHIDGKMVLFGPEAVEIIHKSANKPINITVLRGDSEQDYRVIPQAKVLEKGEKPKGAIGFVASMEQKFRRAPVTESIYKGFAYTYGTTKMIFNTIFMRIGGAAVGQVPVGELKREVGGPISIFFVVKSALEQSFAMVILLTALLSVNLGVVNVLPIPVLDGGHLALLVVEGIRGKRLSPEKQAAIQWVGLAIILMMMIAIFAIDITRLPFFLGR